MAKLKIGNYQVLGTLGTGAHSKILHVRRSQDSKNYALKVVPIAGAKDAKFLEQARHEYDVAQMLDHPNLIKVYALETERDWLFRIRKVFLLIEYVHGKTLDTFTRQPISKLVQIFVKIAQGLAHMHRRHVYHADLKPNNILLSRAGDVKIIDFGLAWIKGKDKDRIQGTPEYMAPEQARQKIVNEQSDIYNFGATMYRLVTWRLPPSPISEKGALPITGKAWDQMIKPVQEACADAPPELCTLIHKCLSYHPNARPERVSAILEVLESIQDKVMQSSDDHLEGLE